MMHPGGRPESTGFNGLFYRNISDKMKVTFIYPDVSYVTGSAGYYYQGIGYLAAVLKQRGHAVSLLHVTRPLGQEEFRQQLARHLAADGENLVAFSATTNKFPYVLTWSQWLKESFPVLTICGGVHPTLEPEDTLRAEGLDAVCVGEGEHALAELCDRIQAQGDISSVPNIWIKQKGEIYRNSPGPLIDDLETLPFPDREVFDYPHLYHEANGEASVMASRGCPYDCYYCCNHVLRAVYEGQRYVRFRSVPNIIGELKQILARYPFIGKFAFDDDILPLNKTWFEDFALTYRREINRPFSCNIRPNLVTEDLARLLQEAGCYQASVGIESGNPWVRENMLNRHLTDQQIISAIELLRSNGIRIYTYNMVGLPHEGMKEILDTVQMNATVRPDMAQISIFYPYRGTKLFDICKENSLLTGKEIRDYFEDTSLALGLTRQKQIQFIVLYFPLLVRTYQAIFRLPRRLRSLVLRCTGAVLAWKITAFLVLVPLLQLGLFITRHEKLAGLARAFRRRFFFKQ
jgi:anaerobic magnesium-protoporphyrin IX monomethyl ester cyclase